MKGVIPFGGMTISGPGAATQALSTSAALLAQWSATGGANVNGTFDDGIPSVYPDKANNRLLLEAPGVDPSKPFFAYWYEIDLIVSGITDAAQDIVLTLAKNATAVADAVTRQRWTNAVKNTQVLSTYLPVYGSDNPGTLAVKPAYDASAGAGKPAGGFGGAAAFANMMVPVTVLINSLAGTPTITFEYAILKAKRVG